MFKRTQKRKRLRLEIKLARADAELTELLMVHNKMTESSIDFIEMLVQKTGDVAELKAKLENLNK